MRNRVNLVQAEFFLANGTSLEKVMKDVLERASDASPSKICLRFYDHRGIFTRLGIGHETRKKRMGHLDQLLPESVGWRRRFMGWQYGRLLRKHIQSLADARSLAVREVLHITKVGGDLAIEANDHAYRAPAADEIYEIRQSVQKAGNSWIFGFEPAPILADKLKVVFAIT